MSTPQHPASAVDPRDIPSGPTDAQCHVGHADHHDHEDHAGHDMSGMAAAATLHCLTGCAIGEIAGLVLGAAFGWGNVPTTVMSVALAFVFGYSLSAMPLLRAGIAVGRALSLVLAADTLSIATMEAVDNLVMWLIPGAMGAGLADLLFWVSMAISFVVAYAAAYPVNRALLRRGRGHAITHHASGEDMDNRPLAYALTAFLLGGAVASLGSLL